MKNNSQEKQQEEVLADLEVYIETLKDIVEDFKLQKRPSNHQNDEFLYEYINLEDNILLSFQKLSKCKNRAKSIAEVKKKRDNLIKMFNIYWKDYQDGWSEEFWKKYEILRNSKEKNIVNPRLISEVPEYEEKNTNQPDTLTLTGIEAPEKKEETLSKIDEDINQIEEVKIIGEKPQAKKRGCIDDCRIF